MSNGCRRGFDLFLTLIGLIAFAPIGLLIAFLIYREDQGLVFFEQKRIGRNQKPFCILKFRTMKEGRITSTGKWLRATGLDELPQFINVFKGNMCFVGPRPLTPEDIIRLEWTSEKHTIRWSVHPGITGSAQLFGGGDNGNSWYWDLAYIKNRSLSLDMKIILISLIANIFGKKKARKWSKGVLYESKNDFTSPDRSF
jgi:lipopolysaccharide/colanic/teichoic acid biosynthesis glycosyltransferase